jgi:4a-hydroxytetrahydrobiopterin dehydratase
MSQLMNLKCVACRGGEPTLKDDEIASYQPEVPDWQVIEEGEIKKLVHTYKFKNFQQAVAFTNQVAEIAELEDHHPLLQTEWGRVKVMWWTHKIRGLHKNDFIMAAKTDEIYRKNWTE